VSSTCRKERLKNSLKGLTGGQKGIQREGAGGGLATEKRTLVKKETEKKSTKANITGGEGSNKPDRIGKCMGKEELATKILKSMGSP